MSLERASRSYSDYSLRGVAVEGRTAAVASRALASFLGEFESAVAASGITSRGERDRSPGRGLQTSSTSADTAAARQSAASASSTGASSAASAASGSSSASGTSSSASASGTGGASASLTGTQAVAATGLQGSDAIPTTGSKENRQLTRAVLEALGDLTTAPAARQTGRAPLNSADPELGEAAMSALRAALARAGISTNSLQFTYFEQQESFPGSSGYWNHYIQVRSADGSWANMRADLVRDWPEVAVNDIQSLFISA